MKVLIINTSEKTGGAAIASNRLMDALCMNGIQATMLVCNKQTDDKKVISLTNKLQKKWKFVWERMVIWINNLFSTKNLFKVSIANTGFDITHLPEFKEADIIHLHWINQGMLSLKNIRQIIQTEKAIAWTMHDMWECTGICHHAYTCQNFKNECKECPFLRFPNSKDLAYQVFKQKQQIFQTAELQIVTVSQWLATQVKESALLGDKPVTIIPNTLSLAEFKLLDQAESRQVLGLPAKSKIILFGAARIDDPIKGFTILLDTIRHLITQRVYRKEELHLVTFGKYKHPEKIIPHIPVAHTDMGWIKDNAILSQLYSASDIAVSSSLYETFGQTLIEAQACGCIPVSFGNSGQTDIIQHKQNGYLADYLSVEDLATGIQWGFEKRKSIDREKLREEVLDRYSCEVVAKQYIDLYKRLINSKPAS